MSESGGTQMFVQDRSEDVFKTIRHRGLWWIPANEKKIHGELVFSTARGGSLELEGELPVSPLELDVIHGETSDRKRITIFGGFITCTSRCGSPDDHVYKQTLDVYDIWIGPDWFNRKEDITFQSYSFGIHNLENWADLKCFSNIRPPDSRTITLAYKIPEEIPLFEDDKCTISLASGCSGPSFSVGQLESTIAHYPCICIRAKNDLLPYYGENGSIAEREWMIFVLIALLMGKPTWQFGFSGLISPCSLEDGFVPEISYRHYYQKSVDDPEQTRKPTVFDLLFPFDCIRSDFTEISAAFSKLFHDNGSQIEVLFQFLCKKKVFEASTLPNLLFAFEELETNLLKEANIPFEQQGETRAKRVREQLMPHCGKGDREWASQRLSWQGLSYTKRLRIALSEMRTIYPGLDRKVENTLVDYLSKTRNTYAHEAKSTSKDYSPYILASYWIAEFMTLMLWHACGLSLETIKTIYFRPTGPDRGKTQFFFNHLCRRHSPPSSKD